MKYTDNLIIGAGIGGVYLATRLKKIKPKESILIVDRNKCYGGRLACSITDDGVAIEMGGIRLYETIHKRVLTLARKYNSHLTEYLPSTEGHIIYLRGVAYNVNELYPNSDQSYNINENEKGKNPFIMLNENLNKLFSTNNLHDFETRIKIIKGNIDFSTKTFQDLAQMDMSDENFQRVMDILGYYDLLKTNTAFIILAIEFLSISNNSIKQYRIIQGFASLIKKIADDNNINVIKYANIKYLDINKDIPNISCSFKTEIIRIKKNKSGLWIVHYGYTKINSIEEIYNKIKKTAKIKVKNIYYTGTIKFLTRIYNFSNTYYINSFIPISALRIYLRYSTDWMTGRGIGLGKTITTLDGGQIIHYADKYIMFYIIGYQSNVFLSTLPRQIQYKLIVPEPSTYQLIDRCNKVLKTTFDIKDDLPLVTDIAWAYWNDAFSMYSARNLQTFDTTFSLVDIFNRLMFPFGKHGNFYVVSNEIGMNTGWCEGSLENVDYLCNQKYKQPLFDKNNI